MKVSMEIGCDTQRNENSECVEQEKEEEEARRKQTFNLTKCLRHDWCRTVKGLRVRLAVVASE